MSWFTLRFFVGLCVLSLPALAQRISFDGNGEPVAHLETSLSSTNGPLSSVEVRFSLPAVDVDADRDGFEKISVQGLSPLGVLGSPDLFTTGALIVVPDGFTPLVRILENQTREVEGISVRPAERKLRCECKVPAAFAFNSALYGSSGIFPAESVRLEEVGRMQDLHFERVALYPIQMDLGRKSLRVTTALRLEVSFQPNGANRAAAILPPTFYGLARALAANGQGLGATLRLNTEPETLIIVVADQLREGIKPLVGWKRAKGMRVVVVTYGEAGGSRDKVKEYLQNYYNSHAVKPSYLLFVGNKDTMPPYMEEVVTSEDGPAASDYRFALLSGKDPLTDPLPDVLYGRLVADDLDELGTEVKRLVDYEQMPDKSAAWYPKALTIASNQGFHPSDEQYAQQVEASLRKFTYTSVDRFYQRAHTATGRNISGALEEGRSWVSYFGHGGGTSWLSVNDTFNNHTIAALKNTGRLPVVIDVACDNASYAVLEKPFGKAWVTQVVQGSAAGAVAYFGASVSVTWDPPAIMSVGVAKYHFEKPVPTLGGSVLAGQLYLIEQKGKGVDVTDNLKWYNLFGDPSLLVRTSLPKSFQIRQTVQQVGKGIAVTVTATDPQGKPMPGLLAALGTGETEAPLATAIIDANGQAKLEVKEMPRLPQNTLLTVSGYNAETFQSRVTPP